MISCGVPGETPTVSPGARGWGALCSSVCRDAWEWAAQRWPGVAVHLTSWAGERSTAMATASYREITEEMAEKTPQHLHRSWWWGKRCKMHHWKPSLPWEGHGGGQSQKSGSEEGEGSALTQSFHFGGDLFSLNPQHDEIPGSECVVYINI